MYEIIIERQKYYGEEGLVNCGVRQAFEGIILCAEESSIYVTTDDLEIYSFYYEPCPVIITLPPKAKKFLKRFESGKSIRPITFGMIIPENLIRKENAP